MTEITQLAAQRRIQQGLDYLLKVTNEGQTSGDPRDVLAVTTVMAYLAAYAYPDGNLWEIRQHIIDALAPLKRCTDTEALVMKATALAEVFRRPWTEPQAGGPTI